MRLIEVRRHHPRTRRFGIYIRTPRWGRSDFEIERDGPHELHPFMAIFIAAFAGTFGYLSGLFWGETLFGVNAGIILGVACGLWFGLFALFDQGA